VPPPSLGSQDTDPHDRRRDRLLARLGLLDDARPLFGSCPAVPRAGVLLALPALIATGVFASAEQIYGSLGPAFFGLRTTFLVLLLMALWRIRRPEGLKEHSPAELGRVLGVDRAPEVKTLRRKLAHLAAFGRAADFGRALARQRVAQRGAAVGFLYVDGHVRVYHGQHRLPKAHVARTRLSMPATSEYWVNDTAGDPLFVVTAEANAGLVKRLPDILLADQEVRLLRGKLRLRQVTRRSDNGHQTPILTSRRDLSAASVAHRMFDRWRQENFFKYIQEEFALDALVEYTTVPDAPTREVPNPAWAKVDAQLSQAKAHLECLQAQYGLQALANEEQTRRTMRGFKSAHGKLGQQIWDAWQRVADLIARRTPIPRRVPVQAVTLEPVVNLAPEIKHLTNLVKMVACQTESELVRAVAPYYRRVEEEGRTLIQAALLSAADLEVAERELRVTLLPQSSPHRTRAMAALCDELNAFETRFPGSRLRLRYAIHTPS
jgi:hypothetical protein